MVVGYIDLTSPGEPQTVGESIKKSKKLKELEAGVRKGIKKEKVKKAKATTKKILGKTLFTKDIQQKKPKKIFGSRPTPPDYTQEQNILRGMFGHGGRVMTNFDGRSLPKIHNTLNSGGGLIKSGDKNHETAGLFYGGKALPFFGGQGRT